MQISHQLPQLLKLWQTEQTKNSKKFPLWMVENKNGSCHGESLYKLLVISHREQFAKY